MMHLEFQYGAREAGIEAGGGDWRIALTNPACGRPAERWALPAGDYARRGDFHLLESGDYVLGAASVQVRPDTLAATTESLYGQLLGEQAALSIYRTWHFVPGINEQLGGDLENYRAFCLGRANAFQTHVARESLHLKIPAASAVGTRGEYLTLIYLGGRQRGTYLENPRQTPAYEYPLEYGPKPPSFARATAVDYAGRPTLFISGTSSILASESIGDSIESQLATTLENLHIVASQSPIPVGGPRRVRVYLRHAGDYDYVKAQLEAHYLDEGDEAFYIVADICRKELLVEIEATIGI